MFFGDKKLEFKNSLYESANGIEKNNIEKNNKFDIIKETDICMK